MNSLDDWLAHCERLHPKTIDMTLDRVRVVKERLGITFDAPVVTVAGTNGKGSTCAMLESIALRGLPRRALHQNRIWCTSRNAAAWTEAGVGRQPAAAFRGCRGRAPRRHADLLRVHHLAILRRLQHEPLDLVILEVGFGGVWMR